MTRPVPDRHTFSAAIFKVGINPAVDVPAKVSKALGIRGYVPVFGDLDGHPIRSTLVPIGNGRHRLYINGQMRKAAGVGPGDTIRVTVQPDEKPRELPMPTELHRALSRHAEAKAAFDAMPRSHRREILAYLNSLKKPETIKKNVGRLLRRLEDESRG